MNQKQFDLNIFDNILEKFSIIEKLEKKLNNEYNFNLKKFNNLKILVHLIF